MMRCPNLQVLNYTEYPAVCCNDGLHCCPAGYQCDARTQSCILSADDTQLGLKVNPKETPKKDNTCPVEEDTCEEWQTCCKMADGHPGCCPLANVRQLYAA
ncbi:unnamed protein product [Dibothriocephalus latus]|uniref:Granulins domain-containing protein n=1 Tax=Dibothriocephalus latus TaxID=60516 RepID=A0A3P7NXB2_DIBLA|nr:unnamed protein product [Dibothriocephalus latus]